MKSYGVRWMCRDQKRVDNWRSLLQIIQVRDIDYLKEGEWEERGENLLNMNMEIEA